MSRARKALCAGVALVAVALAALALALRYDPACGPAPEPAGEAPRMQAVVYRCYGSPEVLELADVARPAPAAEEILVRVHAASVNPLDWHYMRGTPRLMRLESGLGAPATERLGVDFAGRVEAVGAKVTRFRPGDAVFGGRTGAFAQYVTVREDRAVAPMPANVTFAQAAAVPIAGVTALQALRDKGRVQPGQKVLVNGASGGVGTFAVQIAKALGAEVTGVCSARNAALVRALGADRVVDYAREDFTQGGERYDLIVDMVGNHPLAALRRVLTPTGILVIVGGPNEGQWLGPLGRSIEALAVSPFVGQELATLMASLNRDDLMLLKELMEAGKLTPVLDRAYALSDVPAAIRYVEEGHARGKVVIDVEGDD